MITKSARKGTQVEFVSLDQLVPEDHILRKIDETIDFSFIYDLVEDKYSTDNGRPSIDPVSLIKIPIIQYLFGIKSMRQTIKEIEVNVAYRWFLGLGFYDPVPHFSTFGKNYKRRFEGTDLFEQIFEKILFQCMKTGLVDTETIFVDATHVKAAANRKKSKKILVAKRAARYYDQRLKEEINADREAHGKKHLKDEDDDDDSSNGSVLEIPMKEQKQSTTDPESGWFHKGEHKEVFAYGVETGCDKHGWILSYTVHPGNEHDSTTFPHVYEKLRIFEPKAMVLDAGYKNPPIAKLLMDDGITPIFPYKRPMTRMGFFKKNEYVYDEYYDCYLCPNDQVLKYSTTNRDGYREYKSDPKICASCSHIEQCTHSKNHQKVVTRHVWERYMDIAEDIRLTPEAKELYNKRRETIERIFGTAKEHHAMRYTQQVGKEKMAMKIGLTFACMNMKKLAKILSKRPKNGPDGGLFSSCFRFFSHILISSIHFREKSPSPVFETWTLSTV